MGGHRREVCSKSCALLTDELCSKKLSSLTIGQKLDGQVLAAGIIREPRGPSHSDRDRMDSDLLRQRTCRTESRDLQTEQFHGSHASRPWIVSIATSRIYACNHRLTHSCSG